MDDKPVVFILRGDDTHAMEQFVKSLYARMGDPGLADLNTARLDGRTSSEEDIRTAATSLPFLAERRLVVLAHPLARLSDKTARERFLALLDGLPATTAMVLEQEDSTFWDWKAREYAWKTLRENHWLIEWARKAGKRARIQECALPKPEEMPARIIAAARERGGQFTLPAAQELAGLIGADPQMASLEIDKLLSFVNYERPVEPEDVIECTTSINPVSAFEMLDALGEGNSSKAQRLLRLLLDEQDAFSLYGLIVSHFRQLLLAREILNEGGGTEQIIRDLSWMKSGMFKSKAQKLAAQAARYSLPGLEDIYRRLAQMDEDQKSGVMPIEVSLETFVADLKPR